MGPLQLLSKSSDGLGLGWAHLSSQDTLPKCLTGPIKGHRHLGNGMALPMETHGLSSKPKNDPDRYKMKEIQSKYCLEHVGPYLLHFLFIWAVFGLV